MAGFPHSQNPGDDLYNGFLFPRQRMNRMAQHQQHGTYGTFPSQSNFAGQEPYYPPAPSTSFVFVPSGSPPPGIPLTDEQPSTSGTSKGDFVSKATGKRWEDAEVKLLIEAYKDNHDRIKSAKSCCGKKSAWETLYDDYIQLCNDAKIKTTKTLVQAKEKWRALFDKYKAVCDNNQRTGRGRMDFEYFEAIGEFMGQSDKVNPKFVKETAIINDRDEINEEDSPEDTRSKVADETDDKQEKKQPKKSNDSGERPKKRKKKEDKGKEESEQLMELLERQQKALQKSEENDREALETLLQFQNDAEKRHQEFMVSVLGKLGDIFSKK